MLTSREARALLDSIETDTLVGLRDRALIALLVYGSSEISAAIKMSVEDYHTPLRPHQRGKKCQETAPHHDLHIQLKAYISAAGISEDRTGPLFRAVGGKISQLTRHPLLQQEVHRIIRLRAAAAGIGRIRPRKGDLCLPLTGLIMDVADHEAVLLY